MWFKSECDKISDRLWDYTAQRLSVTETAQIEKHLQQCAKCQAEAEGYRQTLGLLSAARSMSVPASQTTWRDLRPSLQPERRAVTRSADWLPRLTLAGAGTVMAATLLVVFLSNGHRPGTVVPPSAPSHDVAQTAPAPVQEPEQNTVAQNDDHDSNPVVTSGPTVASFAANAFAGLPNPSVNRRPPHVTLPAGSLTRLTRPRHNYVRSSQPGSGIGHSRGNRLQLASYNPAHLDGDNVTPRAQQNYVLKTVSPASDDETPQAHRYVLSSIPSSQGAVASNEGGDEGRAW